MSEANSGRETQTIQNGLQDKLILEIYKMDVLALVNDLKLVMSVLGGDSSAIYPEVVVSVRNLVDGILGNR